jgi:hypothetical protein
LILLALLGITLLGSLVCLIWMVAVKFSNGDRPHLRNSAVALTVFVVASVVLVIILCGWPSEMRPFHQ